MRYRRIILAAGAALLVVVATFLLRSSDQYEAAVQQIVETLQTYGGEHVERLIALGSDGVPAIGDALSRDPPFPLVFVLALEGIGDERGGAAVFEFVMSLAPFSDVDRRTLTALSIEALGKIGDASVARALLDIARDSANHPRVRLASAAAICRLITTGEECVSAGAVIFGFYRDHEKYFLDPNAGFIEAHVLDAVMAVDSVKSKEIVLAVAQAGPSSYVLESVVTYLMDKPGDIVTNALLSIVNDKERHPLPTRLEIAFALADRAGPQPILTKKFTEDLMEEATTEGWPGEVVEQARRLEELIQHQN